MQPRQPSHGVPLQRAVERLRSFVEHSTDSVFCYEYEPPIPTTLAVEEQIRRLYDGVLVECNSACARSYGLQGREQALGKRLTDLFGTAPRSLDEFFRSFVEADYSMVSGEGVEVLPDGGRRYYRNSGRGEVVEGALVRVWGVFTDITNQKLAEAERERQAALLHSIVESLPFDVFAIDSHGSYVMQNSVCREHWGNVLGRRPEEMAPDAATRELWASNNRRAFAGEVVSEEVSCRVDAGDRRLRNIISPIIRQGAVDGIVGVNIDVTELTQANEALRRERDFANALLNAPHDTVFLFDPESKRPIRWNSKFAEVSGYSDEEIAAMRAPDDFYDAADLERAAAAIASILDSQPVAVEMSLLTRSGEAIPFEYSGTMVRDAQGRDLILSIGRDLSARRRAEAERMELQGQLVHAQKLEEIGRLASGIAHDFNNLLVPILGNADLMRLDAGPDSRVGELAGIIRAAAEKAAMLCRQLLGYARKGKVLCVAVDVNSVVTGVARILSRTLDRRIVWSSKLSAARAMVMGDPGQLEQVVMNLAINARDAMPDGGSIELSTELVQLDQSDARVGAGLGAGAYVRLSVTDTGTGMTPEIAERAFEPFFTTKPEGYGSGMGLAMVYGIVANHGGTITLASEKGRGTTVELHFPLAVTDADRSSRGPREDSIRGDGTILLIDDERVVRDVVRAMLVSLGYQVVLADGGRSGLECYRTRGTEIDLVVLDLTMPEMDGVTCLRELRKLDPAVRVLVASGHGREGAAQALLEEGTVPFIQKPFLRADLSQAIAGCLAAGMMGRS